MRKRTRKQRTERWGLCLALLLALSLLPQSGAAAGEQPPGISAECALLLEWESGTVLYEKAADRPMQAASTLKLLTALTALDSLQPAQPVVILPEWTGQEGSSMYLRAGETYTVRELLLGLLLASGNDAARALACAAAGTEADFVRSMNEKAAALGMSSSVFVDASGLRAEGHHTTARDLGTLACAALKNETLRELMRTKSAVVHGQTLLNHNKLLWRSEGTFGGKTGYTMAAGRTLISCTEREDMTLVCVTLRAPADWADHMALLDWGYDHYRRYSASELTWELPLVSGLRESVPVRAAGLSRCLRKDSGAVFCPELPPFLYAPVEAGETVGMLRLRTPDGSVLGECALLCDEDGMEDPAEALRFWEKLQWYWYYACRHSPPYPVPGYIY